MKNLSTWLTIVILIVPITNSSFAQERVFLDNDGIIRWVEDSTEVALFGANYCLPSACDYRAASYFTDDLKAEIRKDLAHFSRMGWDALRICFWGDYQNSDSLGNLVNNEHLNLMHFLVAEAKKRL